MTTVVFTGEGKTPDGRKWKREQWIEFANAAQLDVANTVRYGYILVASEIGTKKAKAAHAAGNMVMTYEEFYLTYESRAATRMPMLEPERIKRDYSDIELFGAF